MPRKLRFIPPNTLVEVTAKTLQARFLLRPGTEMNRRYIGILARAKARFGVKVHAVACLSNHHHLLVSPEDAEQLASFMEYVQGNVAREIGSLHDWQGSFWWRRYDSILVSDEPEMQVRRVAYVLAQGCKEGLVARPELWPGVHSVFALREGIPLRGVWYDRTAFALESRGRQTAGLDEFATEEALELDPLPCWEKAGLSIEEMQSRIAELVEVIAEDAAAEHRAKGTRPADPEVFLRVHPHQRPAATKRSPAPRVHAILPEVRAAFEEAYRLFSEAFRDAAARLKRGMKPKLAVGFPGGSFPPGLPFVPLLEPG
jgi:REP element-mobilizing transposase RayT